MGVGPLDSTVAKPRPKPSHESSIQSAGLYYRQTREDAPPAYIGYASGGLPTRPNTLRDEHHFEAPHGHHGLTNGYDHTLYNQGQIRQYSSYHSQPHLQYDNPRTPTGLENLEHVAIRASPQHLRKPIAIPATGTSLGSPFLRAYPPSLEAFEISREEFLDVLDGLNRVSVQSPPLRALGLVGEILEVVPLGTVQAVGFAINATAQVGRIGLSKGATELYLRKANKEIFAPRGLKMAIAKLEAMAQVNRFPILDTQGRIRDNVQLLQPLLDVPKIQTMGVAERWLQALEPWVEPLDLETLPPINTDTNLWGRLHTMASERERKNSEKKILKDRSKAYDKHQKGVDQAEERRAKELTKLARKEQKARDNSRSHKVDDKLHKIDQERGKVERKHSDRMEKVMEDSRAKDEETKAMTKVLWLMIQNVQEDSGSREIMDISE
ncbi:hypothetical protein F4803DRAFT_535460 [Xylaria telfairii]|nr:hypothetical protein F4803DRAFT_535460 [Xylaria telfairii]